MQTTCHHRARGGIKAVFLTVLLSTAGAAAVPRLGFAQINPAEITNPELKPLEQAYFQQLKSLNRSIADAKFPFVFALNRYVGVESGKNEAIDSRGIEFVRFHERTVLKVSGNYGAAYNSDLLTENERASKIFEEVVEPILTLVTRQIPSDVTCDAIGFEISYHSRTSSKNYDYEGREILVAVLSVSDALSFTHASTVEERQEILNRSEVFVNGKAFGLDLGQRDPLVPESKDVVVEKNDRISLASAMRASQRELDPSPSAPPNDTGSETAARDSRIRGALAAPLAPPVPVPTQADIGRMQSKYQPQLDALAKEGAATFRFVDYDPPSFAIFQKQIVLQMTLRNPQRFDREKTSIYKRAAQSFDLYLAPLFKDLLDKLPYDEEISLVDCSVLNQLSMDSKTSAEAVEFVMPRKALTQFAGAEITNQQLIDQSVVLVNGVRIALNLQIVE